MPEITATEASRRFAGLLDGVEHRGESYTILRRGRVVAQLDPAHRPSGASVKAALRSEPIDGEWAGELAALRGELVVEERF
jgi:prevent-host-death family protein